MTVQRTIIRAATGSSHGSPLRFRLATTGPNRIRPPGCRAVTRTTPPTEIEDWTGSAPLRAHHLRPDGGKKRTDRSWIVRFERDHLDLEDVTPAHPGDVHRTSHRRDDRNPPGEQIMRIMRGACAIGHGNGDDLAKGNARVQDRGIPQGEREHVRDRLLDEPGRP